MFQKIVVAEIKTHIFIINNFFSRKLYRFCDNVEKVL